MILARYANVPPSEFYSMTDGEAQGWIDALQDLMKHEQDKASSQAFMRGDFDNRM